jgi:hypothetical protein
MTRPAFYFGPAVFAQAWKDAFAFAVSRGLDKAKFNARSERAERGDLLDDAADDDTTTPEPEPAPTPTRAHDVRAFVVVCGEHTYEVSAIDRNEAAKAARKQHATLGRPPGTAWRVRSA